MAYDQDLANRVRHHIHAEPGLTEKHMFGGLAFLINGNLAVSASNHGGLLLRVNPDQTQTLLNQPHTQPFTMRGRAMHHSLARPARRDRRSHMGRTVALDGLVRFGFVDVHG
jgi:hypothetical protein